MSRIYFKNGDCVIVDKHLYDELSQYGWSAHGTGYAQAKINGTQTLLHWMVIGKPPKGFVTDHINRNKSDNRRSNLRHITHAENMVNRKLHINNTSGVAGVIWKSSRNRWQASLFRNSKFIYLGTYKLKADAIKARRDAERKL